MQPATGAVGGFTTTLDIAALVSAIAWPLLVVIAILLFRDRLVEAAKWLAPRLKSISIGAFSFELAAAQPLTLQMTGAVDLRHAGQSGDVNDSTLRSFYEQIADPSQLDYAVVDLGEGREWLTSRLFILSIILSRMRGLRAFVFVETAGHVRRRFVGVGECEQVRWRLAMRFPWFEAAVAHAEATVWPKPADVVPAAMATPLVANEKGRLEWANGSPEPAAQLLRAFLDKIQVPVGGTLPDSSEWETLPGSNPPKLERAQWLTAAQLEHIMGAELDQSSVHVANLHMSNDSTRAALLVAQPGRWVALTREDRVFDSLVDRRRILETIASRVVQTVLDLHILTQFDKVRVTDMDRSRIKLFLLEKLHAGLQKRTVRNIHAVLRALLNAALEDGLIAGNPAAKLGRSLKLTLSKATVQEEIKALTKVQRQVLLATAAREAPRYYSLFFVMAGTGMRLGEALALQTGDIDFTSQTIRVSRAFSEDGTLDTPKSGHGRTVDISQSLAAALQCHLLTHKQDKLKYGWEELPCWLFITKAGTPLDPANVRRSMQSLLKKAKLPLHFTPHCLRHTYASILLADGVSPVYVQEQLGHATIELTVSTYGRWLKKQAPGALDRLDGLLTFESGSKVVADRRYPLNAPSETPLQLPDIPWKVMEPATRIERATCGLRNRCSTN